MKHKSSNMSLRSQSWAPGHATLFFAVPEKYADPKKMGSLGAGFNFRAGVLTKLEEADDLQVTWNNEPIDGVASKKAYDLFCEHTGFDYPVSISHYSELKIGYGLSTSGAGAIGTVLSLYNMSNTDLDTIDLFEIAHRADVENNTGLGSVIGQMVSGIEIRSSQGGPRFARMSSHQSDQQIILLMMGELKTSDVLESEEHLKQVTKAGLQSVDEAKLVKTNYADALIKIGQKFTELCGLETDRLRETTHKLSGIGENKVSMAMIGETLVVKPSDPKKVVEFARKYNIDCVVTNITNQKPYILQ